LNSDRVLRWRLLIESFAPKLYPIKGTENPADALTRLPVDPNYVFSGGGPPIDLVADDSLLSDPLFEIYLNYPAIPENPYPLDFNLIAEHQATDEILQQLIEQDPTHYERQMIYDVNLICYKPDDSENWKIYIPKTLEENSVKWFHHVLNHPGILRQLKTMSTHFYIPKLKTVIENQIKTCDACQRFKLPGLGRGELPPRNDTSELWEEVAVDLIGPWKIQIHGQMLQFHALTATETQTTLTEIIRIDNKTSAHVATKFEQTYLARYPRPMRVIQDNGAEFLGEAFQSMLSTNGIKSIRITPYNPQSNSVAERMHQTIGNVIRTRLHTHPPVNLQQATELIDICIASAMHASRTTIHTTINASPGAIVFQRDMLFPLEFQTNLQLAQRRRQELIDLNNRRANRRRFRHDYKVGEEVLILINNPATLEPRTQGPFLILQVHTNGTLTIQRNANLTERINIRRVRPYFRPPHGEGE
jgi:hypothetical protein